MTMLRRRFLTNTSALGVLASVSGWSFAQAKNRAWLDANAPPMPDVGTVLALPTVTFFDGSVFRPEQAQGRITLIYWWASTCPFCALQSPEMQKFWHAHKDKGLQMLALSVDRTPQEAMAYLQKRAYTFPAAWVTPEIAQILPKPKGLPITLVRGRDGKLLQAERGQLDLEDVAALAQWL